MNLVVRAALTGAVRQRTLPHLVGVFDRERG